MEHVHKFIVKKDTTGVVVALPSSITSWEDAEADSGKGGSSVF